MADQEQLQALAAAIQQMKGRIEAHLTLHEKQVLRGMIASGAIESPDDLRAYVHRAEEANRRRAIEQENSRRLQEVARRQEEEAARTKEQAEKAKREEERAKAKAKKESESDDEEDHAKLTGKVIDAKTRRPIPYVSVQIKGTPFSAQTETTGTFIFDDLGRGKTVNIDCHHREYKPQIFQFKATMEDEQMIVIKLVALEDKSKKKKKSDMFGGH